MFTYRHVFRSYFIIYFTAVIGFYCMEAFIEQYLHNKMNKSYSPIPVYSKIYGKIPIFWGGSNLTIRLCGLCYFFLFFIFSRDSRLFGNEVRREYFFHEIRVACMQYTIFSFLLDVQSVWCSNSWFFLGTQLALRANLIDNV